MILSYLIWYNGRSQSTITKTAMELWEIQGIIISAALPTLALLLISFS
jgi:hypothetical protein